MALVALLIFPIIPSYLESNLENKNTLARTSFECSEYNYNLNSNFEIDAAFIVNDDDCVALVFQGSVGNEILDFNILGNSSNAIDSLIMDSGVYYSYLNEQKYHINPLSNSYLIEKDPSIENLTEDIEFTWSIPSNENYILVLDNMRHPADEGRGAGGGISVSIGVSVTLNNETWEWTPYNSIIQLEENLETENINDEALLFDEGDIITIKSNPLFGNGEIGLASMNDEESLTWISETLIISEDNELDLVISSEFADSPLWLTIINQGNSKMATTITIFITPTLNPIIEIISHNSTEIQLEDTLQLDASSSPNKWNQIENYNWDIENIGIIDSTAANAKWDSPGQYSVSLEILRSDGATATSSISITVVDLIEPNLRISGIIDNALIEQNSDLTLNCDCGDNHQIDKIEWIWDSDVNPNQGSSFILPTEELGLHTLEVKVTDMSGNLVQSSLSITIIDATAPELISVIWPDDNIVQNSELDFKIKATDPEDSNLIFRWDIDLSVDSNNDGDKRNDWIIGAYDTTTNEAKMSYTYSNPGVYTVMVQVLNSENRKLELTHSVVVSQASPPETSSMVYLSGGIILLGLLAGGGFIAWKNIQERISKIEEEGRNLTPEERAEIKQQELSQELYGDDQTNLANIANVGSQEQQWSRPQAQQINYHDIAGIPDTNMVQNNSIQTNNIGNNMLEALMEEPEIIEEKPKEVEHDLSFLKEMKKEEKTEKQKSNSGLKMEIPGMKKEIQPVKKNKGGLKIELPPLPKTVIQNDNNQNDDDIDL